MMLQSNKSKTASLLITAFTAGLVSFPIGPVSSVWPELHAQSLAPAATPTSNAPASGQLEAPLVDWSHAQHVYKLAEGWLRQGDPLKTFEGDTIEVSGLTGVRVTLRYGGKRMGTGHASFEAATPVHGKALDLTEMTRTALRGAMLQFQDMAQQSAKRANENAPAAADNPQPAEPISLQLLLMDIQIAGRLQPIAIPAGSPAATLYHRFAPGYHGLRMSTRATDGTPLASWLWPADSIAAGQPPHNQILQLMTTLGIKINQENIVARTGGPTLERFEVIHMVRPAHDQPITRLTRGNLMLPPTSIDGHTLDALASRLAAFLQSRQPQQNDGHFRGTYLPSPDRYLNEIASADDSALACFALTRWANTYAQPDKATHVTKAQIASANAVVRRWFAFSSDYLTSTNVYAKAADKDRPSATTLALSLLCLTQNSVLAPMKTQRDQIAQQLMNLRNGDGSFRTTLAKDAPAVDVPVSALIVDSLASYYLVTQSTIVGNALPATMAWVWDRTDPLRSIAALPWLLEADASLETLTTRDGQNDLNPRGARAARLARLLPTIEIMTSRQIVAPPAAGPADVIGGFELSEQDSDAPPNPDWRTAHMLMVISRSLRNPDLAVGRNRVEGILACGRAARFLGQLMIDEPGTYYMSTPSEAIGGVRPVLWDNRLDLAPSAMALLAACDLHQTLAQWAQNQ